MKKGSVRQYGALPYRQSKNGLEILLITTRRKRQMANSPTSPQAKPAVRWSIPKGWPMAHKAPHHAAATEAFEEAGLVGIVSSKPVGWYKHKKRRGKVKLRCEVELFPFEVDCQKRRWPE